MILLTVAAVDERSAADTATGVLARPAGTLLGTIQPGIGLGQSPHRVLLILLLQLADQSIVAGRFDERQVRAVSLQQFLGWRLNRFPPAGTIDPFGHLDVALAN